MRDFEGGNLVDLNNHELRSVLIKAQKKAISQSRADDEEYEESIESE